MGFVARYAKGTDNVVSPSKHHIVKGRVFLVWNGWARYLQWLALDLTHSFDLNGYRASATSRGTAAQRTLSYSPYQI